MEGVEAVGIRAWGVNALFICPPTIVVIYISLQII
jgi:hypothetical protein